MNEQTILEIKNVMKTLATLSENMSEINRATIKSINMELKELCEFLDY